MPSWKITPKVQEELKNNLNIHFQIIYKDILDQNEILKVCTSKQRGPRGGASETCSPKRREQNP